MNKFVSNAAFSVLDGSVKDTENIDLYCNNDCFKEFIICHTDDEFLFNRYNEGEGNTILLVKDKDIWAEYECWNDFIENWFQFSGPYTILYPPGHSKHKHILKNDDKVIWYGLKALWNCKKTGYLISY